MRTKQLALAGASAAALVAAMAGTAAAAPAAQPNISYSCPNHYLIVQASTFLKVHYSPDLQSGVPGELPHGVKYCLGSTEYPKADGYTWAGGYGYNGSVKVAGWAVTDYLGDFH